MFKLYRLLISVYQCHASFAVSIFVRIPYFQVCPTLFLYSSPLFLCSCIMLICFHTFIFVSLVTDYAHRFLVNLILSCLACFVSQDSYEVFHSIVSVFSYYCLFHVFLVLFTCVSFGSLLVCVIIALYFSG